MVNLVSGCCEIFFPNKNVICIDRGISQVHDNKISISSASCIIRRTQLKFKRHSLLRLLTITVCQEK